MCALQCDEDVFALNTWMCKRAALYCTLWLGTQNSPDTVVGKALFCSKSILET